MDRTRWGSYNEVDTEEEKKTTDGKTKRSTSPLWFVMVHFLED
jgi:hypothetical protein